jgi:hypothetical protein
MSTNDVASEFPHADRWSWWQRPLAARTRGRRALVIGSAAIVVASAACGEAPVSVGETLREACAEARDRLATAPEPTDADSDAAFLETSKDAASAVGDIADDLAERGDDSTIADLAWQLHRIPASTNPDDALRAAHEAQAAIRRIDEFAQALRLPECRAATWRPTSWRTMADHHGERPGDATFRSAINRLCAKTFPHPSLLADGAPLLKSLVADQDGGDGPDASPDDVKARLLARLNTVSNRPSEAARFIRDFSNGLPAIRPSQSLDAEYTTLLAALLELDAAIPSVMPREPTVAVRERVYAALDHLQAAWDALSISC